jgi:hypothetical protein
MRRRVLTLIAGAIFLFHAGYALAQDTLNEVERELQEATQQHNEDTTKVLSAFFTELDAAMASPDAALALYTKAKGEMPAPVPVVSEHESETATEREAREALDQANLTRLATALQLHCGLMHYAALFALKPDQRGLQDQWVAWLNVAAQAYPQLAPPHDASPPPSIATPKKKHVDEAPPPGIRRPPPFYPEDLKGRAVRDSIISKYLAFKGWNDKESGGWSIRDIPRLFRTNVLDPLRKTPSQETLTAWDFFIAMADADERDNDRWDDVVYPPLQFDRACDAYTIAPSTEKLEGLVNLIKTNTTYPHVDDWISKVHALVQGYRTSHGLGPAPARSAATTAANADPNVTVTTERQGDMTIVTTHTNSPTTNTPPPANGRPSMGVSPVMNMQSVMDAAPIINPRATTNAPPVTPTPAPNK